MPAIKEERVDNVDINALVDIEAKEGVDLEQFDKSTSMIDLIEVEHNTTHFDPSVPNAVYNPDKTWPKTELKVSTKPMTTIKNKDGLDVEIRAFHKFALQETGDGKLGVSKNSKSKLRKFMNSMKVDKVADLKGKKVVVKTVKTKKGYVILDLYTD